MKQFTLRQLEYFVAVARHHQISAAAQECLVSQSALSAALFDLEASLGVQLVVRRPSKGVRLTSDGARLLPRAQALIDQAADLHDVALEASGSASGSVTLGIHAPLSTVVLPEAVEWLRQHAPGIDLLTVEESAPVIAEALSNGTIDLAVLYDLGLPEELVLERLARVQPHLLVPADHRLTRGRTLDLALLADEPLILLDVPPSAENTERILRATGLEPRVGVRTSNFETVRCLVGRGLGYSVLFQRPPTDLSYEGRPLAVHPIDRPSITSDVVLASVGVRTTRRTQAVRQACIQAINRAMPTLEPRNGRRGRSASPGGGQVQYRVP